jgi:hypothetical protein
LAVPKRGSARKQANNLRFSPTVAVISFDALKNPEHSYPAGLSCLCIRRLFEVRGGAAMMTELEFLNRFQRSPNGIWACTKPINVNGPNGLVIIGQGARFGPGTLFLGLDLAKELDQMAAKHGLAPKPHQGS